ncbi:hypothetical protein [Halovivax sp.]|uniref:hypothetical protein n=1 Tax=Halovivax sp. TaxID=1935978 RepID=UPI0025BF183F|nr:hypothetical protein [Halovivax sp.]
MSGGRYHPPVTFDRDGATVRVRDALESAELTIDVDGDPAPEPALEDVLLFPVDEAITVSASSLRFETAFGRTIWDENGDPLDGGCDERGEFPHGTYYVSIVGAVKVHLRINDAAFATEQRIGDGADHAVKIDLAEPSQVTIGARSLHSRPEATITVPDDPDALLEALPYVASSIKEFSCERSWPTLRGHPPTLERGEEFRVPPALRAPETGVAVEIPATYEHCFQVAPLVFYLGAAVRAADRPALALANGHVEPLETARQSVEERVADLLSRCLLLDSLVRESGYTPTERVEYDLLAPHLPFYPPNLYDVSLSEQLLEYLEVSRDVIEPFLPEWPKTAVLRPAPSDVKYLSPLLHELALIRVERSGRSPRTDRATPAADSIPDSALTAHTNGNPQPGTCLLAPEAFEHARDFERPTSADARIAIATREPERARSFRRLEDRLDPDASVRVIEQPTVAEFGRMLSTDHTILYSDLPGTERGVRCADGTFVVGDADDVGATAVGLAAGASPTDCLELVSAGAVAGFVTDDRVRPGVARPLLTLFANGFTLQHASVLAGLDRETDVRYVGDASVTVVRRPGESPILADVRPTGRDEFEFELRSRPTDVARLGAVVHFEADDGSLARLFDEAVHDGFWLVGARVEQPRRLSVDDVATLVEDETIVVKLNDRLLTGDGADVESIVREAGGRTAADAE